MDTQGFVGSFILAALAIWRVARLLAYEDGPFDLILRLRVWSGAYWGEETMANGQVEERWLGASVISKMLICPYCLSFWLSVPAALWLAGPRAEAAVVWLALAGAVAALHSFLEGS